MSKMRKGYDAQDRVLGRFQRDARSSNSNSAAAQCMKGSAERKAYREKMAKKNRLKAKNESVGMRFIRKHYQKDDE